MNGTFIGFCLTFSLVPYVLPVIMPTWRWLAGAVIVIGGLLSALMIDDWITRSHAPHAGPGGAFGVLIASLLTIGFASGVGIRAITLALDSSAVSRVFISLAGLPLAIAILVLMGASHVW